MLAHFACGERTRRLHQDHSTSFGKAWLTAAALAVHQFQEFVTQDFVTKHVGEPGNRLLNGSDALHDLGSLPEQAAKLILSRAQHFLDMNVSSGRKVVARHTCR